MWVNHAVTSEIFPASHDTPCPTGTPGKAEFIHSYNEAVARKVVTNSAGSPSVRPAMAIATYPAARRAPHARSDYVKLIKGIEKELGDFPLAALTDRRTRGIFMTWRDKLAARHGGRLTMRGRCWRGCCQGVLIAGWCWRIRVRAARTDGRSVILTQGRSSSWQRLPSQS